MSERKSLVSEDKNRIADQEIFEQLADDQLCLLGIDRRLV